MMVDELPDTTGKKVSFAPDAKSDPTAGASTTPSTDTPEVKSPVDGVIGKLEVYRSGAVKIRLANGILLDVSCNFFFCCQAILSIIQNFL